MIEVKNLIAVSGVGGVLKIVVARKDGVIAEDVTNGSKNYYPQRSHTFSPFEAISVYTTTETVSLAEVFALMLDKQEATTIPSEKSDNKTLRAYFYEILPEHDTDKVHISDIKKIIKWFNFMKTNDLLKEKVAETETQTEAKDEAITEPVVTEVVEVIEKESLIEPTNTLIKEAIEEKKL